MTLGELIHALDGTYKNPLPEYFAGRTDKERQVYFDWCGMRPNGLSSYRGYYDHLAINIDIDRGPTVAELLERLREAIGDAFTGWKGGEYTMSADTPVWVADPGYATGWGVSGVRDEGYSVVIETKKFDA
jgi:hypothetical protein